MAQWNLSVQLTGQGSNLSSTLRRSAGEARTLSREVSRARQEITRLRAAGSRGIEIGVRLDAASLRTDLRAALAGAGGQSLTVTADVDGTRAALGLDRLREAARDTSHELNRLQRYAREAGNEIQNLRSSAASAATSVRTLGTASDRSGQRLGTLSDRSRTLRGDLDNLNTSAGTLGSSLGGLRGSLGSVGQSGNNASGGLSSFLGLLISISTAAVPLSAGIVASVAPIAQQFGAAGVAAGAFGAAIAGQITTLTAVSDAETKVQEATKLHGVASEEAEKATQEYLSTLDGLPPATLNAALALSELKTSYQQWSDSLSDVTMTPLTHSFAVMETLLPKLTPLAESAAGSLDRLVTVAGGAVVSPGFDSLMDRFDQYADGAVDHLTDQVIHLLRALSEGDPGDGALGAFLAYLEEHGPAAREALTNVGEAVGTIVEGAAEAGPVMLTLVSAIAELVAALPPELVGTIIQVYAAFKLITMLGSGLVAVAGGVQAIARQLMVLYVNAGLAGGGLAALRAGFMALSAAARASIIVAAIAALAVAAYKLGEAGRQAPPNVDKLTSSLARLGKSGKVGGEAARLFGQDLDTLYDSVRNITDPSTLDNIQNGLVKVFSLGLADSTPSQEARERLDAIDQGLTNLVQGGKADIAAAAFERLKKAYAADGKDVSQFTGQMDDYKNAVADAKFEAELAAEAQGLFGRQALRVSEALEEQKAKAEGLRGAIVALNETNRAAASEMSAFEQAIDDAAKAAGKYGDVLDVKKDGHLDLDTKNAREAEKVLNDLAASTDAAATAAVENGESWEHVTGIYERGRDKFVAAAEGMGLTKEEAEKLAGTYLKIPEAKTTTLQMRTEDALADLGGVIDAIKKTPDKKSVTVDALAEDARLMLEDIGFKVTELKDGRFKITADTETAKQSLGDVEGLRDGLLDKSITIDADTADARIGLDGLIAKIRETPGAKTVTVSALNSQAIEALRAVGFKVKTLPNGKVAVTAATGSALANIGDVQAARDRLADKSITITTVKRTVLETITRNPYSDAADALNKQAERFGSANGNIFSFYAGGGLRPSSTSEQHVAQLAPAGSWRVWAEPETGGEAYIPLAQSKRGRSRAIAEETIRRLGGDPESVRWYADGGVTDWRYDPQTGSLYTASDAGQAGHKTKKVKVKGKTKEIDYFDLGAVESKLKSAAKATRAWNSDLQKVADRVGGDVAEALAAMGKDGMKLADKMANGSTKYINDMAKALRDLQKASKASLTDYTRQLTNANKVSKDFADDLAKLAAMGYGDLASQLAAQGDTAAQQLADAASKDKGKAADANKQAKAANNALTGDQVQSLVQIIAAIKTKSTGIHDVAATTGLGEDEIITVANKAKKQISDSLGSRAKRFLEDLGKANKMQAYADGGIRAGLYATSGGIIRFAEPETGGEAYLPLGASKRAQAMPVLRDVATRFGVGLQDAGAGRQVVVVRERGPLVGEQHWHVGEHRSQRALMAEIEARTGYQLRRLSRGGVGVRG